MLLSAGSILIAYSWATCLLLLVVLRRIQLLLTGLLSSFFCIIALLLASLIWAAASSLHGNPLASPIFASNNSLITVDISSAAWVPIVLIVIAQELLRFGFIKLYTNFERRFSVTAVNASAFPLRDFWASVAAGWGWSTALSLLQFGSILGAASGPGVLYSPACSLSSYFVQSIFCWLITHLHPALFVIALHAFRTANVLLYFSIIASNFAASLSVGAIIF